MKIKNSFKEIIRKIIKNKVILYLLFGVFFGAMFPLTAFIFELIRLKLTISFENISVIHDLNPVLYMIDTAPIFLGFFAMVAGCKQCKTLELTAKQNDLLTIDTFTGLSNKYSSELALEEYKKRIDHSIGYLTVVIISIKNLKRINSIIGIEFGDNVILVISQMLKEITNGKADLFRISGNEFMFMNLGSPIKESLDEVVETFKEPIKVLNTTCLIEINVGVAYCDKSGYNCDKIVENAYTALEYHGKNKHEFYSVYNDSMKPVTKDFEMESELFYALKRNEFFLVYQPLIDAKTKKIKGTEALIRWRNPNYGIVPPNLFIPTIERTNLIIDIGLWVIREACRQNLEWQKKYDKDLFISINVSVIQLFDVSFVDSLNKIIEEIGINKESIRLEITESMSQEKRSFVRDKITHLNKNGYKLSIDDFGTGYSSLAELDNMPLHCIKVDKSFVDRVTINNSTSPIIESIIEMAHQMDMKIVMEGVETEVQYEYLKSINSDFIQGYYFSKPLESFQMEEKFVSEEEINLSAI